MITQNKIIPIIHQQQYNEIGNQKIYFMQQFVID